MTDPVTSITLEIPTAVAHKISETAPGTLADTALIALRLYHGLGLDARTTLTELATHHSLTPAKTLRLAIEQLKADTTRLQLGKGAAGRPIVNGDRDADIYAKTQTGITHAAVAAEYGLSIVRVGQIVAKQRAMRKDSIKPNTRLPLTKAAIGLDMDNGMSAEDAAVKYGLTVGEVIERHAAYRANLPANPNMLDKINAGRTAESSTQAASSTQEVLTLKEPPRKLAVIPPSMRNPELFAEAKPIKIPDPAKVDMSMFDPNNPDFAI
jgi:hypothetical protein